MKIGIPKERVFEESRVGLAPAGVYGLTQAGHTVFVEKGAGDGSNFSDTEYEQVGAKIVYTAEEVYQRSDMIVKVNRVTDEECGLLKENQILFSALHLAVSDKRVLSTLLEKKITAIGYELIEQNENLPVLQAMSEIAGQVSIQVAERLLESTNPLSRGVLLGGISGVAPAAVVILGAGMVGTMAARAALGRGASVIMLDKDVNRLRRIDALFDRKITTVRANPYTIARGVKYADVFIGAVLIKAIKTPHVVTEEMVKTMKKGAVLIDVSIDQGGCIETSRPTSISDPTFVVHNVIHCCVPNLPALVARTASYGLTNATIDYIQSVADKGLAAALTEDTGLAQGVCTYAGYCSKEIIADTLNVEYRRIHFFSTN
ncbi:MAG: alanine dehydrogenase [Ignavibacteria bacterium]|nr:alanine dehydrogenase [Ignavibacteria bacterium]